MGMKIGALSILLFSMCALGFTLTTFLREESYTYDAMPHADRGSIDIASHGLVTTSDPFAWADEYDDVLEADDTNREESVSITDKVLSGNTPVPMGSVLGAATIAPRSPLAITHIKTGAGLTVKKGKVRCVSASDDTFGCISGNDFENFSDKVDGDDLEDSESLADLIGDGTGSGALVFGTGPTLSALSLIDVGTSTLLATNESGVIIGTSTIAVTGFSVLGSATTTFQHGINLASGCFAVSGVCVTGGGGGGGITDLNGLIATTQSFATSSDTNIRIAVTSSGSTHTFTPSWNGVLSIARGGTGTSTAPATGQLLMGNATGGYDLVATSSLGFGTGSVGSGTTGQIPYYGANGSLLTATSSVFIGANSNVGIGSTTPWAKLSVTNTSNTQPSFVVEDATSPDQTPFIIDAQGRVGIGSSSPIAELVVSSANPSFLVDDTSAGGSQLEFVVSGSNTYMRSGENVDDTTARFRLVRTGTTNTNVANFDIYASTTYLNGQLAIGTTTPQSDFHIHNATGNSIITITGSNSANRGFNFNLLAGTPVWSFLMDSAEDLVLQEQRSGLQAFRIKNTAGTDLFLVDSATGNLAIGTSTLGGMLRISDATSTTGALFVSSSQTTPGTGVNLATFQTYDANWDRPLVRINDVSTSGSAANVRLDSPNPDIEFVETDQVAPAGKFEIAGNGNRFQINSRRLDETAFENILEFAQRSQTSVDALTLNLESTSATRNALKIINASSSAGAQPGIAWRNEVALVDTARISSLAGTSGTASKLLFEVANASKALTTRMVIDVAGSVGIGTTSPWKTLSVVGDTWFSGNATATNLTATGTLTVLGDTSLQSASTTALSVTGAVFDGAGNAGTSGYILQTTGSGVTWVATSSLGIAGSNYFTNSGASTYLTTGTNLGIGTSTPSRSLSVVGDALFTGNATATNLTATDTLTVLGNASLQSASTTALTLTGKLFDVSGTPGSAGMVLQTTGSGIQWVATSSLGISGGSSSGAGYVLSSIYSTTSAGTTSVNFSGTAGSAASFSTASLTLPSDTAFIVVEVWGGGGGGGGADATNDAGGGGGGGYTKKTITSVGSSYAFRVGAGGAGNTSDGSGTTGGTSHFGGIATSTGGTGGVGANSGSTGGAGGSGSGGDVNMSGDRGYDNGSYNGDGGDGAAGGGNGGFSGSPTGGVFGGGGRAGQSSNGDGSAGGNGGVIIHVYTPSSNVLTGTIGSGSTGQLAFYTANGTTLSGTSNLYLNTTNNAFGIGTTAPHARLSVDTSSLGTTSAFIVGSSTQTLFQIANTGRVSIGTTTTTDATGDANALTIAGASGSNIVRFANTNGATYNEGSIYMLGNPFNGVQFGSLTNTGVGIFTNNGSPSLHVNANGGVSLGAYADTNTGTIPPTDGLIVSGTTGIGSSTPSSMLTVSNVGSANSFTVEDALADQSPFLIDASGNVSIGTTSSNYKLTVSGDILIANNTNTGTTSTSTNWTLKFDGGASTTAQFSDVNSLAVYNGSLYMGLGSTSAGGGALARYDGTTTTIVWRATSTYESVRELWVHDGLLYFGLGDSASGEADILSYNSAGGATTSVGQLGTSPDYVDSFATFEGKLYACGSGVGAGDAEIYRYDGGTTWTLVNDPGLNSGCDLEVFNGAMYAVALDISPDPVVMTSADGTTWSSNTITINTPGQTRRPRYVVYNDRLLLAPGTGANIYYDVTHDLSGTGDTIPTNGQSAASGYVFNGTFYMGQSYTAGDADISVLGGVRVADFASDAVHDMIAYNGQLYAATGDDAGEGDLYVMDTHQDSQNSFGLNFTSTQAGMTSLGTLWFEAGDMFSGFSDDTTGLQNAGTFKLSHTLVTAAGSYDVAEDYPSVEDDLMAGDILAFDPENPGYVRRARMEDRDRIAGALSARPGFLLSSKDRAGMVPMALVGRVPVQVSTEGGPVEIGDSITLSSTTAGVGKRAQFGDVSVGYALEPLPGGAATTSIMVYVTQNNALHMGVNLSALDGTSTPETLSAPDIMDRLVTLAKGFVDGVLRVAGIRTDLLCVGNTCVNEAQLIELLNTTNNEGSDTPDVDIDTDEPTPPVPEEEPEQANEEVPPIIPEEPATVVEEASESNVLVGNTEPTELITEPEPVAEGAEESIQDLEQPDAQSLGE